MGWTYHELIVHGHHNYPYVSLCSINESYGVAVDDVSVDVVPWAGNLNCDRATDFGDINPFVLALTAPSVYVVTYPDCDLMRGDVTGDGFVDFADINPFVALLTR